MKILTLAGLTYLAANYADLYQHTNPLMYWIYVATSLVMFACYCKAADKI